MGGSSAGSGGSTSVGGTSGSAGVGGAAGTAATGGLAGSSPDAATGGAGMGGAGMGGAGGAGGAAGADASADGGGTGGAAGGGGTGGAAGSGGAGGGSGAAGAGGAAGSSGADGGADKRVFVTSGLYTGDLRTEGGGASGVQGADNICNNLASALGGTWRAWVSVGIGAFDRITSPGPWRLITGAMVFPDRNSLQGAPLVPIDVDENGLTLTSNTHVWTGTVAGGTPAGTAQLGRCASWNAGAATSGMYGDMKSNGTGWTQVMQENCNINMNRLYCFEL